jgi:formylglycine-generating enzyme required for sulfatase activity
LDYQERVRNRARTFLQNGAALKDRFLAEALWIGFEHEAMHLETFLYMLLQSDRTLPPIGFNTPDFRQIAQDAKKNEKPNQWFHIPKQTLTIGLNDVDDTTLPRDSFGWDNEKPQRSISVHSFEAQARPITNGEYAKYVQAQHLSALPASWARAPSPQENPISKGMAQSRSGGNSATTQNPLDGISVRTVYGLVPLSLAQDWPLIASYDELADYAKWMRCRIPTFEETRSIYMYSDKLRRNYSPKLNGHR